jgi:hypothetical protein
MLLALFSPRYGWRRPGVLLKQASAAVGMTDHEPQVGRAWAR